MSPLFKAYDLCDSNTADPGPGNDLPSGSPVAMGTIALTAAGHSGIRPVTRHTGGSRQFYTVCYRQYRYYSPGDRHIIPVFPYQVEVRIPQPELRCRGPVVF